MPKTKQANRSKQRSNEFLEECDLQIRNLKKQAKLRIHKMEGDSIMAIKQLENDIDIALAQLPMEVRKLTLGELLSSIEVEKQKENKCTVNSSDCDFPLPSATTTVKSKKAVPRVTSVSDDGYVTETGTLKSQRVTAPALELYSNKRTHSNSRNDRGKLVEMNTCTAKKQSKVNSSVKSSAFKTPAALKPLPNEYSIVTPKVKPNTPLNVLRRPRRGEMVLSMQGSPLLVSAIIDERTANINVPLHNGNVISLLPNDGLRLSHIPNLDQETMRQLKTLKGHIEKVINSK